MQLGGSPTEGGDASSIIEAIEGFLTRHPDALLLEAGTALFDLRETSYKLAIIQDRVVFHLWSEHRNAVRRITAARLRGSTLRLTVQRFGQGTPQQMELVANHGRRQLLGRNRSRQQFATTLERLLSAHFPHMHTGPLRTSMDLQHSFGPAFARGLQTAGQTAWAIIAAGPGETPVTVDGILSAGLLWLALCREQAGGRSLVSGLRVIVPAAMGDTTLLRMAWLDSRIARYELYELTLETEELLRRDPTDCGNLVTRLVRAPNEGIATGPDGRFAEAIPRVLALLPPPAAAAATPPIAAHSTFRWVHGGDLGVEMRLRTNAELAFLRHGMEFARIRSGYRGQGFNRSLEITIGSGPHETVLTDRNAADLRELVHELFRRRDASAAQAGAATDPLFRLQPERWLESLLRADLSALDPALLSDPVYVQVPAVIGAGDRGMLDLLGVTRDHQLAVVEVKVEEDLQLAMQGLDYWIRVRDHHTASIDPSTGLGDLQTHGYFPSVRLRPDPPQLFLVAPALRIHPATETVLRHFDPRVQWTLIALDERWRQRIRPVWRRSSATLPGALA